MRPFFLIRKMLPRHRTSWPWLSSTLQHLLAAEKSRLTIVLTLTSNDGQISSLAFSRGHLEGTTHWDSRHPPAIRVPDDRHLVHHLFSPSLEAKWGGTQWTHQEIVLDFLENILFVLFLVPCLGLAVRMTVLFCLPSNTCHGASEGPIFLPIPGHKRRQTTDAHLKSFKIALLE